MQAIRSQVQVTKKQSLLRVGARFLVGWLETGLHNKAEVDYDDSFEYRHDYRFDGRDGYLTYGEIERQVVESHLKK